MLRQLFGNLGSTWYGAELLVLLLVAGTSNRQDSVRSIHSTYFTAWYSLPSSNFSN